MSENRVLQDGSYTRIQIFDGITKTLKIEFNYGLAREGGRFTCNNPNGHFTNIEIFRDEAYSISAIKQGQGYGNIAYEISANCAYVDIHGQTIEFKNARIIGSSVR